MASDCCRRALAALELSGLNDEQFVPLARSDEFVKQEGKGDGDKRDKYPRRQQGETTRQQHVAKQCNEHCECNKSEAGSKDDQSAAYCIVPRAGVDPQLKS